MKKNAVYIINSLQNGGAERVILTQAEYLLSKDIEVTIICLRNWIQYECDPKYKGDHTLSTKKVYRYTLS